MNFIDQLWYATLLGIYGSVLYGLGYIWRDAPNNQQRFVVGTLMCAFLVYALAALAALLGFNVNWRVHWVASRVEHLAVLIYVFRLFHDQEEKECKNYSKPSRAQAQR